MSKQLNIGLFGFGIVGSGIYQILQQKANPHVHLKTIVVKNPEKQRTIAKHNFSYDADAILEDKEINLVLELIDDAEAAYTLVKKAITNQKNVVTANKKMLAHHLQELTELAKENKVALLYEAAVCGSIPIIKLLEESFSQDALQHIKAISNGTSNYVLTHLFDQPQPFDKVIYEAQQAGFAESDPTLDIDGWDSKFKLIIKNYHAFGILNSPSEIFNLGIRHIKPQDVQYAKEQNVCIKLIGNSSLKSNQLTSFVTPHFIAEDELLSTIAFENNAVELATEFAGIQLFFGKGAGSLPTGSAVFSDLLAVNKGYSYSNYKSKQLELNLNEDVLLRVYCSSTELRLLDDLDFIEVNESTSETDFHFKIGVISLSHLKAHFERNKPAIFITVFGIV